MKRKNFVLLLVSILLFLSVSFFVGCVGTATVRTDYVKPGYKVVNYERCNKYPSYKAREACRREAEREEEKRAKTCGKTGVCD